MKGESPGPVALSQAEKSRIPASPKSKRRREQPSETPAQTGREINHGAAAVGIDFHAVLIIIRRATIGFGNQIERAGNCSLRRYRFAGVVLNVNQLRLFDQKRRVERVRPPYLVTSKRRGQSRANAQSPFDKSFRAYAETTRGIPLRRVQMAQQRALALCVWIAKSVPRVMLRGQHNTWRLGARSY